MRHGALVDDLNDELSCSVSDVERHSTQLEPGRLWRRGPRACSDTEHLDP